MAHTLTEKLPLRFLSRETWNGSRGSCDATPRAWNDGDPRIARALHWAQRVTAGDDTQAAPRLRSLDELIAMGQQGRAWGRVFKQLKAEGLIQEQTLGHVVARWAGRRGTLSMAPAAGLRAARMHAPIRSASR